MSEQNQDNRALLAESLWNHDNPEIVQKFKTLIAEAHPKTRTHMPEVVVREEGSKLLAEGRKMIEDFRKERDADKIARERETWQTRLTKGFKGPDGQTHRVSSEDIPEIEKYMVENDTASPELAAFAYLTHKRVAAPTTAPDYSGIRIPGQEGTGDYFKGLMANPDQWAREKANHMWGEIKAGRGQQFLDQ